MRTPMKTKERTIWIMAPVLAISIGFLVPNATAQSDPYPKMAPVDQYLMEKTPRFSWRGVPLPIPYPATRRFWFWEGRATRLRSKARTALSAWWKRGWMGMFDWPEFWSPKVRAADCLNPQAARSILPIVYLRTRMVMAGRSKAEIVSAVKAAFEKKQLPSLESGAMAYMMSKSAYLTDEGDHNGPHLMFYTPVENAKDWGSEAAGSPVVSSPYWFISRKEQSQMNGLPPILVFVVMVADWSDGTPAGQHND
jgi:hypothetical protein